MVIVETTVFTRQVLELLPEDEYRQFQLFLAAQPDAGDLIRGGGGLRKIRWALEGRGKRGGVRIIYYWAVPKDQLLLLLIYAKSQRDDLTPDQLKRLRTIIDTEYP
jgi:mRNA-degrading endonuclease RelE of RelBE toxin-antitoxin system